MQCACLLPRLFAALAVRAAAWPCAPARARVCGRVCAWACVCAALASVVRAYIVASPAVLPRAGLAANFFEIVFGQSISVQLSSAGMGDAS